MRKAVSGGWTLLGHNQHLLLRALDELERTRGPDGFTVAETTHQAWKLRPANLRAGEADGDMPDDTSAGGKPLRKYPVWFEKQVGPHGCLALLVKHGMADRLIAGLPLFRLTDKGRRAMKEWSERAGGVTALY
jgi:hypothetical protein